VVREKRRQEEQEGQNSYLILIKKGKEDV